MKLKHVIKNSDGKYKVPLNCVDSTRNECITLSVEVIVTSTFVGIEIKQKYVEKHTYTKASSFRSSKKLSVPRVQESGTTTAGCFVDADLIKWL